jgi:hypothetical protein
MKIVNKNIKSFDMNKHYIFNKEFFGENRKYHKWIECIINNDVRIQLEGLGFVKCNIKGTIKEYSVLPKMCYEVDILN